jgi:2-polyprenyl-3-methyl-5-hydroxy-6-metoxy-1,4-benzoquinol methylase
VSETRTHTHCHLCGSKGEQLYHGLKDYLFGAEGEWNFRRCSNPGCELIWLDPEPLAHQSADAYKIYYTHNQGTAKQTPLRRAYRVVRDGYLQHRLGYKRGVGQPWYRYFFPLAYLHPGGRAQVEAAAMYLPAPRDGARLLDIGCGGGDLLARMRTIGWIVEGVDTDPQAVERASLAGISVRLGTLEAQEYPSDYFQAAYMSHVIEHVHDPAQILAECHRILAPGGLLVLITPNTQSLGHRLLGANWRGLEPPRHLNLFTAKSVRQMVEVAGFRPQKIVTVAKAAGGIWRESMWVRTRRQRLNGSVAVGAWHRQLEGFLYQILERVLLAFRPLLGEEILVVASKQNGSASHAT